jgi:shikimate dehydrogenase
MEIGTGTRLIALLGDPVQHSLSPRFQNAAIQAAGLDAVYLALPCVPAALEGLLRGITAAGGAGNITIPHKEQAARLLDVPSTAVETTGACNTFWLEDGRVHGDNTDVDGFTAAARELVGPPAGARVLVLGSGGAARAAVAALLAGRAHAIHLRTRNPDRARTLCEHLDPRGRHITVIDGEEPLRREGYDLVVNATPLGLAPDDARPLDLDQPGRVGAVLDMVYRPGSTQWVRDANRRGIPAADGLPMLLYQGAAAFRRWFGRDPDVQVMRAAVGH